MNERPNQDEPLAMKLGKIVKHCRVDKPHKFKLADHDPGERFGLSTDIEDVKPALDAAVSRLEEMQERLYAQGQWAVLVVLQGRDAAGKDGVIKHVMSGIHPQGCITHAFKAPTPEERAHHFLWRATTHLPERGCIGIFNRSYYEEVLVVRIHRTSCSAKTCPPVSPANLSGSIALRISVPSSTT
jgi:polyphosphate kinase 2 (PPK2 family)